MPSFPHLAVPHLAVIDPGVKNAEVECFNHLVELSPLPLTYHLPALFGMGSLRAPAPGLRGILILGSSSSVYDNLPWQKDLSDWLMPLLEKGTPTLGICFGHQLIAHLYGGKVGFLSEDKKKSQGFREVSISGSRLWGKDRRQGEIFASHRETVETCPAGFSAVGSSSVTGTDVLEHQKLPIFTLQTHPEATPDFLKNLGASEVTDPKHYRFGHKLVQEFLTFAAAAAKR